MTQLFRPAADTIFRVVIVSAFLGAAGVAALGFVWVRSGQAWGVNVPAVQPIPFRHDIHAGELGISCGYCHTSTARAADAGMPSAQTCMTCHSQVWVGATVLQPLTTSLRLNQPIEWTSVNRLPDFAYFHHGAHVANGIECGTCHGDVSNMPKTVRAHTLSMGWCLDCHKQPEKHVDPQEAARIVGLPWHEADKPELYRREEDMVQLYDAVRRRLTDCYACHR